MSKVQLAILVTKAVLLIMEGVGKHSPQKSPRPQKS